LINFIHKTLVLENSRQQVAAEVLKILYAGCFFGLEGRLTHQSLFLNMDALNVQKNSNPTRIWGELLRITLSNGWDGGCF